MPSGFELFLIRLGFAGPMLYIALHMLLEPERFLTSLHAVDWVLRDFTHRLNMRRLYHRPPPASYPPAFFVSHRTILCVRAFGMSLALLSLVVLTGIAD